MDFSTQANSVIAIWSWRVSLLERVIIDKETGLNQGRTRQRIAIPGRLRIVVAFEPWQIVLTAKANALHGDLVSATLLPRHVSDEMSDEDIEALFAPGDEFLLQWEADKADDSYDDGAFAPPADTLVAQAPLSRKEWRQDGLELYWRLSPRDLELWLGAVSPPVSEALSRSFRLFGQGETDAQKGSPSMWDL